MNGDQKTLTTIAAFVLAVVLLFSTPTTVRAQVTNLNPGQSINLATVIGNNLTLQIGDKQFGNFYFSYSASDMTVSNINVTALSNLIGFGLQFQQPLSAIGAQNKILGIGYTATVTDPNNLISDIHLSIVGSAGGAGTGTVNEAALIGGFNGTTVATTSAFVLANTNLLSNAANIVPPQPELWINKIVNVSGSGGPSDFATITVIQQTFSQIPEPSTAFLVGLGMLGVVALKRTRKS